ncbi:tricorn protease N-terminal domain-containing protein [Thozetella sp. PMI_491]|nr:tricorn protease N-terminal domain-containing protein [Thozetella sp. PMI_491]
MALSIALILGVLAGTGLSACPYAGQATAPPACPYASKIGQDASVAVSPDSLRKRAPPAADKLGVMYLNRIAPSGSQLWIADADGSNAAKLMGDQDAPFDYHPSWSPDGEWIVFTSERRADGQADLYRVKPDGTGLEILVSTDSFEDIGVLSPDGSKLAFVSTAVNYTTNIFVKDLNTGVSTNITGGDATVSSFVGPHSFFRPTWSPDGQWLAFSSDVNTEWTGHSDGTGWEHTQALALYVVRPDGSDFRKVVGADGYCFGSPQWSPDGTRLVYYNMTAEATYASHGTSFQQIETVSQIFDVDVATGLDVQQLTSDDSLKVSSGYVGQNNNIGYLIKAGPNAGIHYTTADSTHAYINSTLRDPWWSPDGSKIVYTIYEWEQRQAEKELFSWDSQFDYRFMDVFPQLNPASGRLATTEKVLGNSSSNVLLTDADYSNPVTAFNVYDINSTDAEKALYASGLAGAFQPTWNSDGSKLAVGFGVWFFDRVIYPGTLYLFDNATGSGSYENLTDGTLNAGFPSFSPDGTKIVYRLWNWTSGPLGLHVLDLETGNTTRITDGWDNTPGWSPDGERIVFTRQTNWTAEYGGRWYADRFDICTVKPDGTELTVLTDSEANDAHAVWSDDGRIFYSSGMYGFRDESALYDNTFQPYGQIIIMNADGSNKTMLTDSLWEDSMPAYVRSSYFN